MTDTELVDCAGRWLLDRLQRGRARHRARPSSMASCVTLGVGGANSAGCPTDSGSWRGTRQAPVCPLTLRSHSRLSDYVRCLAGFLDELGIDACTSRRPVRGAGSWRRSSTGSIRNACVASFWPTPTPVGGARSPSRCGGSGWRACLRDSTSPAGAVVARFLPGLFTQRVSEDVRDELSAILSDVSPRRLPGDVEVLCRDGHHRPSAPNRHADAGCCGAITMRRSPVRIANRFSAQLPSLTPSSRSFRTPGMSTTSSSQSRSMRMFAAFARATMPLDVRSSSPRLALPPL